MWQLCGSRSDSAASVIVRAGELVVETDVVTGLAKDGRETATGVFSIPYKQSPSVLSGGQGNGAWNTDVQYWMPFHDGQGLPDAGGEMSLVIRCYSDEWFSRLCQPSACGSENDL